MRLWYNFAVVVVIESIPFDNGGYEKYFWDVSTVKRLLALALTFVFVLLLTACGSNDTPPAEDSSSSAVSDTTGNFSEPVAEPLRFLLTAGEAGEYGKLITYNKGTELEETFYAFYIPEGTYTVTNKGKYMSQVNVYSDETHITEEGWEEIAETFDCKLIDVGNSDTITVSTGQHIEIAEPSVFEFEQQ